MGRRNRILTNYRFLSHSLSLVFAVGVALVVPSVKADRVEISSTTEGTKQTVAEEDVTYAPPAVESAQVAVAGGQAEKTKEVAGVQLSSSTVVADSSSIKAEESANIAEAVKGVNPTATDLQVQEDGSIVVAFLDETVEVIATEKAIKKATKESSAKETTKKAGTKELQILL